MNKSSKILSVIIPVYNLGNYVANPLNSLLPQANEKVEVLIIDDGSTDNTINIVEDIVKRYKDRDVKIIHKKNGGVSSARNLGIKRANGKYIYFLDGDDFVSNDFVSRVLAFQEFDVLLFGFDKVDEKFNVIERFEDKYSYPKEGMSNIDILEMQLLKDFTICACSVVFKKTIIEENELFLNENASVVEVLTMFLKYLAHVSVVRIIPQSLFFYVMRKGSAVDSFIGPNYEAVQNLLPCYDYLIAKGTNIRIARLIKTIVIPGAIVSRNLRMAAQGFIFSKDEMLLPPEIREGLRNVNIIDSLIRKRKRGGFLFMSSLVLFASPKLFYFLAKLTIRKKYITIR